MVSADELLVAVVLEALVLDARSALAVEDSAGLELYEVDE